MSPDGLQKLHNIDAEHAVIGGVLNGGIATLDRVPDLRQGHFFSEPHRLIFAEMRAMAEAYRPGVPVPQNPEMVKAAHDAALQIEAEMRRVRDEIIAARTAAGQPVDGPLDPPLPPVDAENLTEDIADNLSDDTLDPRPA